MSTTLTNGLKLPDKGSVDWYADMQSNYTILDGAVGTVAEHTSQIAGKAPLMHTHTKADITDLFDSANTWSEVNTFSKNQIFQTGAYFYNSDSTAATSGLNLRNSKVTKGGTSDNGSQIIQFLDKDNKFLSQVTTAKALSGTTQLHFTLGNIDSNNNSITGGITFSLAIDGTKQFIPGSNNTHNLGNSSYQWNNLYAKNYYYNGTAWGLDQANTWTGANSFYKSIQIHGSRNAYIMPEFGASYSGLAFGTGEFKQSFKFGDWADNNSTIGLNTSNAYVEIYAGLDSSDNVNKARLNPVNTTVAELGTSTNKWKTLNGINPGALSFPKTDASVTGISTSGFSFDGSSERVPDTVNLFSNGEALVDGWLCARMKEGAGHYIFLNSDDNTGKQGIIASCFSSGTVSSLVFGLSVYVPVKTGNKPTIRWVKPNGGGAQLLFYPCFGNV